jgi:hypothetical protein
MLILLRISKHFFYGFDTILILKKLNLMKIKHDRISLSDRGIVSVRSVNEITGKVRFLIYSTVLYGLPVNSTTVQLRNAI